MILLQVLLEYADIDGSTNKDRHAWKRNPVVPSFYQENKFADEEYDE
jgi:hypothetical protein